MPFHKTTLTRFDETMHLYICMKSGNTNLRARITVPMTSFLFCLESAALLCLNEPQFYLNGQIEPSQTRGRLYSDTSHCGECSLCEMYFLYIFRFLSRLISCSVTRLGDLLEFGQLFKAFGNN